MARKPKVEKIYTGKALKLYEKTIRLQEELNATKEALKIAYKEQIKMEKAEAAKIKREAEQEKKKKEQEELKALAEMIKKSGLTLDNVKDMLTSSSDTSAISSTSVSSTDELKLK